jgi:hypothetical protein
MDAGKDTIKKINVLEAVHYTVTALQQPSRQSKIVFGKLVTCRDNLQAIVTSY